jgi:hypothetical protein
VDHARAVEEAAFLSGLYVKMWAKPGSMHIDPYDLVRALTAKRIPFVLTGTHGISGWTGQPRATKDVDILVKGGRTLVRAVNAVKKLFPQLEAREFFGVYGFFQPGDKQSLIDVTYPHREDLQETLEHPVWVTRSGLRFRVPALECALANKYGAMLTPSRNIDKRVTDIADFIRMVSHSLLPDQTPIDLERLEALGEKVWPGGGGKEILLLVETTKAGRSFGLDDLIRPQ